MMKLLVGLCVSLMITLPSHSIKAEEVGVVLNEARVEACIETVYNRIDFSGHDRLAYDVFAKAYRGYLNLRNSNKLNSAKEILTVCNFDLPSTADRMWIIDLATGKVLFNTYVAHGMGSGEDCAQAFSNTVNSHQSSLGFYVTGDTYQGDHGLSLKLNGMDPGYNDAAMERGIVVHGADYVSEQFIAGNERLGRSWGCPAVAESLKEPVINTINGGTCVFIYYPDNRYLQSSAWINKKVERVPEHVLYATLMVTKPKPVVETKPVTVTPPPAPKQVLPPPPPVRDVTSLSCD